VSLLRFSSEIDFDDFKRLCDKRLDIEKQGFTEGFLDAKPPFVDGKTFNLFFSGEDKRKARLFLGHLSFVHQELLTIYVEGVGVDQETMWIPLQVLFAGSRGSDYSTS